ncbi:ABC transporter permease [Chryseolinea soli]|uniref:ABC transporter permease n=1 Tax=Chryseolinea soli TaxID=2321403 RepID=A0A385SVT1_9BACT|nr:ABC transporter permease [Chryseolinea soli]AYB34646.1 ABC transporter permease [Chryseolinea soli]
MIANYLKVAFRHLLKNKLYVLINTLGMGISIACAMTVYLLIAYNFEFDSTVDKTRVSHVVKVLHHRKDHSGDAFKELVAPLPLGPAALQDIAGITRFTRYCSDGGYLSRGEKGFHETIFFADSSFLKMFTPGLAQGSYKSFDDKSSIFISEKFAAKYFGAEDPLGKEMIVSFNNKKLNAVVGGVLKDAPFNSTFTENILMRIENYLDLYDVKDNDWASAHTASVLFELADIAQAGTIGDQFKKYAALRNAAVAEAGSVRYELVPFSQSISPNDVRRSDLHLRIPSIALTIFMTLGGIILLIACFNLTNTTLALSMKRLKEIGIRKVAGSNGLQIGLQFFSEILMTVTLSAGAGFFLALYIIPEFASMWELPYGLRELNSMNMVIALAIVLFASAVLAGLYPAVFGSRQSPLLLFRGGKNPGGTNLFTRSLLVMQFALCTVVLIAGTVFTRNATYQDNISFGYEKDMLITALIQGPHEAEALREAIQGDHRITGMSPSVHHFAFINAPERPASLAGEKFNATVYEVGPDYFSTVGLKLISGRLFPATDTVDNRSVVVDENFVRRNRLEHPLETKVEVEGETLTIVGVVSDHLTDLESDNTENYLYRLAKPSQYQILVVRAEAATLPETRQYIDRQWKKIYPDKPLQTDLQPEIVYQEANIYNRNLSKIFFFMTVLGCLLSVSGLYAMANLNMTRRTKEIGVRKVLGASVASILKLVNKEFAVILLIATLLGGYGGYRLTNGLLASLFAQHIDVDIITIVTSGMFVFLIGMFSTSLTIWTGATANPVHALRST